MTAWQSNPYSILLFLSVILSSGLAILVWQKRREKYGVLLLSICLAAGIWSFGYAMELGSATLESKLFWAKIQYLGIPIIPILLLMVMLQYTGYSKLLTRRNIILSLIEPIIVTVLFWTNESHKLIWANWELSSQWSTTTLEAEFGGVLWIHLTLAYLALLISVILLILVYRNAEKIYRRQISVMLLGVSFPLIVSVLYIFNISPFDSLNFTPIAFSLTVIFIAWGLFRFQLFVLPPISSDTFIAPHPALLTEKDQRRARFLASVLAVLIPLLFIPELIRAIYNPHILIYFGPALVLIILAYIFSRTRFYQIGVWNTLLVFASLPIAGVLTNPDFDPDRLLNSLIWMIAPLILGSLLLNPASLLIFFIATTGMILSLLAFVPTISFANLITPLSINMVTTVLLLATASIRLRDLHQLEDSKEKIANSNKFLNAVINSLSNPFYVINVDDYSIELANEAARDLGIVEKGTCCALVHRFDTPCDATGDFCPLGVVQKTKEEFIAEHIHYKADNTPYHTEVHGHPIFDDDGNVIQMIEYSIDITERKKANEEIRKLSQAIEQSASTVVITDVKGDIEYANPSFTRVTGYSIKEALGQNPRILKSGKMSPEIYEEMWSTLLNGEIWTGEMINKKKNGDFYWEFAAISPVKNNAGDITHFVAVKDDITRRKKMEEALVVAHDQALEASRVKSQILANVSHDMRTPLGAIIGYAEMLDKGIFGTVNETQQDKLNQILRGGRQLSDFVNNLLEQSEIASGKLILKEQEISIRELLQKVESLIVLSAKEKGIDLFVEVADDVPDTLLGDHYWLQRIVTNLAGNAIKFTKQGHIKINVSLTDKHTLTLQVSDTGIGISKADQKFIFEAFQKGNDVNNENTGSGLGLSIVKDLVNVMGGKIKLDSEVGKGSTFTVLLPLQSSKDKL